MTNKKETEDLERFLDLCSEQVQRNVQVVDPEQLGQDYLLHISTDTKIKKFIPSVGKRLSGMEDRTVPRISTAPTILGCMIGHVVSMNNFLNLASDGTEDNDGYKGGFIIYSFPFRAAIKPAAKLLWDTKISDEYWLVTFDEGSVEYIPETAGFMFIESIRFVGVSQGTPSADVRLFVSVTKEEGLVFSKNVSLAKGYWCLEGPLYTDLKNWKADSEYQIKEIDKAEYDSAKRASADLLSFREKAPSYLSW